MADDDTGPLPPIPCLVGGQAACASHERGLRLRAQFGLSEFMPQGTKLRFGKR
jgi:hypothetical protein